MKKKLYEQANGGEKGGLLTGDKFLMKTESEAPAVDEEVENADKDPVQCINDGELIGE